MYSSPKQTSEIAKALGGSYLHSGLLCGACVCEILLLDLGELLDGLVIVVDDLIAGLGRRYSCGGSRGVWEEEHWLEASRFYIEARSLIS